MSARQSAELAELNSELTALRCLLEAVRDVVMVPFPAQCSPENLRVTSSNPDGGTNVGLWQLGTEGVGAGYSVSELQNALTNARITVRATRNGTDWSQWATPGC